MSKRSRALPTLPNPTIAMLYDGIGQLRPAASIRWLFCGGQLRRCRRNQCRFILQHPSNDADAPFRLPPLLLVDGLASGRHRLGGIAGVKPRSIKLMPKPGTVRQAL